MIRENARTLDAADALARGDLATVGRLMNESHDSLRDDFGVSRHELDAMVVAAREHEACFGARMTGAGFGGSRRRARAVRRSERVRHRDSATIRSASRSRSPTSTRRRIGLRRAPTLL